VKNVRVKEIGKSKYILLKYENHMNKDGADFIWVVGVNKEILKRYGIPVFETHRIHLSLWIYKILRIDFEGYLRTNGFPELSFKLGG